MRVSVILLISLAACSRERSASTARDTARGPAQTMTTAMPQAGSWLARLAAAAAFRDSQVAVVRADSGSPRGDSLFLAVLRTVAARTDSASQLVVNDAAFQDAALTTTGHDSLRLLAAKYGADLVWSEGTAYLEPATPIVAASFRSYLSAPMREFLRIRAAEEAQGFSDDAALQISWSDLAARVATWDTFTTNHPDLAVVAESRDLYSIYLRTYLTGIDNSPVWDDNGQLDPTLRRSYEEFVRTYPRSRAGRIVAGYLRTLASDGYRHGPAASAYLAKAGVEPMSALQPPVR